jgi:hypothetical protein
MQRDAIHCRVREICMDDKASCSLDPRGKVEHWTSRHQPSSPNGSRDRLSITFLRIDIKMGHLKYGLIFNRPNEPPQVHHPDIQFRKSAINIVLGYRRLLPPH